MKRILPILLQTFIISFFSLSFFSVSDAPSEKEVSIFEAIKSSTIQANFQSLGKYSGNSVHAEITNLSSKDVRIRIPSGTIYIPENEGEQTLIQLEDDFIVLHKNETINHRFSGFCTEAGDMVPSIQNSMTIAQNKNPKLMKMLQYMKGKNIDHSIYQDAVWAITDQHNVSNIYSTNPSTKEFKNYLIPYWTEKRMVQFTTTCYGE